MGLVIRARRKMAWRVVWSLVALAVVCIVTLCSDRLVFRQSHETARGIVFSHEITSVEQAAIKAALKGQGSIAPGVRATVKTAFSATASDAVLNTYVLVTSPYAVRQTVTTSMLHTVKVRVAAAIEPEIRDAIARSLSLDPGTLSSYDDTTLLTDDQVAIIPATDLSPRVKLLAFNGAYYLDSFTKGALFRLAQLERLDGSTVQSIRLALPMDKRRVLKINQTGVTALTRKLIPKLHAVGDAAYFSQKIGPFLADADVTHVSNEVSFQQDCSSYTSKTLRFCAPTEMLKTLQASGVDVVELTGNHNNDYGTAANTATIDLYHQLGWHTFGGGRNAHEAAQPFVANYKHTRVAFLGYNYWDSPRGAPIAQGERAGANSFDLAKIAQDIAAAKENSDFVIVDVQFVECYAYPDGYVEMPSCYKPIPTQRATFTKIIDLGADMVVGTQAHQPQTYEFYKGKPVYYGLGNLYFDQTAWPGTERSIVLTHYLLEGRLLQTKLTPTVYDKDLQPRVMKDAEAIDFLTMLDDAR